MVKVASEALPSSPGADRGRYRCGPEGKREGRQSLLGVPSHGEGAAAARHLHEVVGRMSRFHELSQSMVSEDGIVRRPIRAMSKATSSVR